MSLKPVQMFLIHQRKKIELGFLLVELGLVGFLIFGGYQIQNQTDLQLEVYLAGVRFGQMSLVCYLITLVPGIMQRLRFQPLIGAMIMPFRRHFGILMFIMALTHYAFIAMLPFIFNGLLLPTAPFTIMGFFALLSLLPLWLTSNDPSQRFLGKNWKRLHKLTYLALALLFGHVALQSSNWAVPVFGMMVLEIASWFAFFRRSRTLAAKRPATQVPKEADAEA